MILTEKETTAIKDLQTQEQSCIEKYRRYGNEAKDQELKSLFQKIEKEEQTHHKALGQVLSGSVPSCDCNDYSGQSYSPKATYSPGSESEDKKTDCFLATDCIGTEKMDIVVEAVENQTTAITQVTEGIDQISSVVQTNSATAQESAAASQQLSAEANGLKQLVDRFTLSRD